MYDILSNTKCSSMFFIFFIIYYMMFYDTWFLYNLHYPFMQIEYIWSVCEREIEREIIKCVSLSTEGEAHTSPYSLPRCSASPCCCLSYWMILTFTYSVKNAVTAGVFVYASAFVPACVGILYDEEPKWNHSSLLRLFTSSGSWVHLQEQNYYLQMWPLQLKSH